MFIDNDNHQFVVRYAFNGSDELVEKTFNTEAEAYGFYHGLENVHFRCLKIKTTVTTQIVVLFERDGFNALREVKDG